MCKQSICLFVFHQLWSLTYFPNSTEFLAIAWPSASYLIIDWSLFKSDYWAWALFLVRKGCSRAFPCDTSAPAAQSTSIHLKPTVSNRATIFSLHWWHSHRRLIDSDKAKCGVSICKITENDSVCPRSCRSDIALQTTNKITPKWKWNRALRFETTL